MKKKKKPSFVVRLMISLLSGFMVLSALSVVHAESEPANTTESSETQTVANSETPEYLTEDIKEELKDKGKDELYKSETQNGSDGVSVGLEVLEKHVYFENTVSGDLSGWPDDIAFTPSVSKDVTLPSTIPTVSGRQFIEWNTNEDGSGTSYAPGTKLSLSDDLTLYAQWVVAGDSWYVIYDGCGGSNIPKPEIVNDGDDAVLSSKVPESDSFVFKGWTTNLATKDPVYQAGDTLPYDAAKNVIILYALWELKPVAKPIMISFDANGVETATVPESIWIEKESPVRLQEAVVPLGSKYIFLGWDKDATSTAPSYNTNDDYYFDDDTTLYAIWSSMIEVTFNANGVEGAKIPDDVVMNAGESLMLGTAEAPLGSGYGFLGWSKDPKAEVPEYEGDKEYIFDNDSDLFAIWDTSEVITLTFKDSLPGEVSNIPDPINLGPSMSKDIKIPDEIPERSGRVFTGWNTAEDGTGKSFAPGTQIALLEDTTLWAQWHIAQNSWYVVYNANGGTDAPKPQIIPNGEDAVISNEIPQHESLKFAGWATDLSEKADVYLPGETIPYDSKISTVVLYALWNISPIEKPITVTYYANGLKSAIIPEKVSLEKASWLKLDVAQAPLGSKYIFLGWDEKPSAKVPSYEAGVSYYFEKDTKLYAIWTEVSSKTLTFKDSLSDPSTGIPSPIKVIPSESPKVKIPAQIPQKSGRTFVSWNTAKDGSGISYKPGESIYISQNTTLWAQWKVASDSWYLSYNANGGSGAPASQIILKGEDAVISKKIPTYGELEFKGWVTDKKDYTKIYKPGETLKYDSTKDVVTLYALWDLSPVIKPITITFNANGGSQSSVPGKISTQAYEWVNLPSKVPTWDGTG